MASLGLARFEAITSASVAPLQSILYIAGAAIALPNQCPSSIVVGLFDEKLPTFLAVGLRNPMDCRKPLLCDLLGFIE